MPELADINWKTKLDVTGKYVRKDIYKDIKSTTDTEAEQVTSPRYSGMQSNLTLNRSRRE